MCTFPFALSDSWRVQVLVRLSEPSLKDIANAIVAVECKVRWLHGRTMKFITVIYWKSNWTQGKQWALPCRLNSNESVQTSRSHEFYGRNRRNLMPKHSSGSPTTSIPIDFQIASNCQSIAFRYLRLNVTSHSHADIYIFKSHHLHYPNPRNLRQIEYQRKERRGIPFHESIALKKVRQRHTGENGTGRSEMGGDLFLFLPSSQALKLFFQLLCFIQLRTQLQTRIQSFHSINIVYLPLILIRQNLVRFADALEVLCGNVFHLKFNVSNSISWSWWWKRKRRIEERTYMRSLVFVGVVDLGPLAIGLSDLLVGSFRRDVKQSVELLVGRPFLLLLPHPLPLPLRLGFYRESHCQCRRSFCLNQIKSNESRFGRNFRGFFEGFEFWRASERACTFARGLRFLTSIHSFIM